MENKILYSFLGLFLLGILIGYFIPKEPVVVEKIIEVESQHLPILELFNTGWGENLDNPNQIIFSGWLYNYGDVEVKNITANCYIKNIYGDTIIEKDFFIGGIASHSRYYKDFVMDYIPEDNVVGGCKLMPTQEYIDLYSLIDDNQKT